MCHCCCAWWSSQAVRYHQHCVNSDWPCLEEIPKFDHHGINTPILITKKFRTGEKYMPQLTTASKRSSLGLGDWGLVGHDADNDRLWNALPTGITLISSCDEDDCARSCLSQPDIASRIASFSSLIIHTHHDSQTDIHWGHMCSLPFKWSTKEDMSPPLTSASLQK